MRHTQYPIFKNYICKEFNKILYQAYKHVNVQQNRTTLS